MKRRIFKLGLFLLLLSGGAIINVAVAWGCVANGSDVNEWTGELVVMTVSHLWTYSGPNGPPSAGPPLPSRQTDVRYVRRPGMDTAFGWPRVDGNGNTYDEVSVDMIAGWPTRCMSHRISDEPLSDGWRLACRVRSVSCMPGFAINTIFYAAILWLLFAAPLRFRRYRCIKRGLCPACAYPIGTNAVCTECGKPVNMPLVRTQ